MTQSYGRTPRNSKRKDRTLTLERKQARRVKYGTTS